jgi:peptidoglycan/LPS O-acetylase OafA/YrhL
MAYVPRLDSLRFFAAFAVIAFHCGRILPIGWMGVPLFFVLSGYLITGILMRSRESSKPLKEYLWIFSIRRCLRIMPLYFGFVVATTIFFWIFKFPPSFVNAAPFLYTYTLNFARMMPGYVPVLGYDPLWSLAIEWQFYLAWPFVICLLPRRYVPVFLIFVIGLAPVLRAITEVWLIHQHMGPDQRSAIYYNGTWTYLDAFALGGILNWKGAVRFFASNHIFYPSLLVFIWALAATSFDMASHGRYIWENSLLDVVMTCIIAISLGDSALNRITENYVFQRLGKISYGIYVYHGTVTALGEHYFPFVGEHQDNLAGKLSKVPIMLAVAGVTIVWAHLSFEYFESYFLKMKRRISLGNSEGVSPVNTGPLPG